MIEAAEFELMRRDAERYRHLRDGKTYQRGSAPFVMNPKASVLYAIASFRSNELDAAVDEDMLNTKMHQLHEENEIVERGVLAEGMRADFMDESYCDLLEQKAVQDLKFDIERANSAKSQR